MQNNILQLWNDTPITKSIIDFVNKTTDESSPDFIPEEDRIGVFDNDGTLWTEQTVPVQVFFALDRMKELAELNPEMKNTQPFKAFFEKDIKAISKMSKKDALTFMFTTHDGKTPKEFEEHVKQWFENAVHPKFKFSIYKSVFKPQVELLQYLRKNGFKTFIVSGGGIDFMRSVADKIYGIPSHQVIGSSGRTKIEYEGSKPLVRRIPELFSFDDRDEKVNNIHLHIGKRPVFSFGNSDGDLAMLRYTINGDGPRMAMLLHHDDADREVAYDKEFKISPLNEALEVAAHEGIKVVSMKDDWKEVF